MGQIQLAVLAADPYLQAARLSVAEIRAAAHLKVLALPRAPGLDVAALHLQVRQIARAALQLPHWDVQAPEQVHRVVPQLVVPHHAVLGAAENDHLLFLKLVDAVYTALLQAVRALLLAEAGGIARQRQRQLRLRDDLVYIPAYHRVLRRAYQIQVLALYLVHHRVHLREGHDALDHVAVYHERRNDIREPAVYHEVARIRQHSLVQTGDIAYQIIETVAGHAARGVEVYTAETLHDLSVIGDVKLGRFGLAEALHFHIIGVVGPDGHAGVYHLRNAPHDGAELLLQLGLHGLELSETVGLGLDLGLHALGLLQLGGVLFGLAHQHTDLFGQRIARGTQVVGFGYCGAQARVIVDGLID